MSEVLVMEKKRRVVLETLTPLVLVLLALHLYFARAGFLYGAIGLLVVMLFIKPLATVIADGWLKFAGMIALVNTKVLLTVVFFLLLTPVAFLFRIFTRNPLRLKAEKELSSYYTEHDHLYTGDDLDKLW